MSGHETFPLRLLWLKKAYDAVAIHGWNKRTFQEQFAIGQLGVGKNMALSMRHWAVCAGVLDERSGDLAPSPLGKLLFDDRSGLDPYLEDPSTIWLVHSALSSSPQQCSTFFFTFNMLNQSSFDREGLTNLVFEIAKSKNARATHETIKRDVEVFVRSYAVRPGDGSEDAVEPLLGELGLIRETRLNGQFEFVRGPKPTLHDGIFALSLIRFWRRWHSASPTLSAEQVSYGTSSPGKLFKMDEDSVMARLSRIGDATNGAIVWTDTAGLRQVSLTRPLDSIDELALLTSCYSFQRAA